MLYAVYYGDLTTIRILQGLKVSILFSDFDNRTPLHIAASEGNLNIVQYLLYENANVLAIDLRGNDPRADAIREKKLNVETYITGILSSAIIQ